MRFAWKFWAAIVIVLVAGIKVIIFVRIVIVIIIVIIIVHLRYQWLPCRDKQLTKHMHITA